MPFSSGFRTPHLLTRHFRDHGQEFAATSEAHYETLADNFCRQPVGGTLRSGTNSSNDLILYDEVTNEFAVIASDSYIRTYFKPDPSVHGYSTNLDYFIESCKK